MECYAECLANGPRRRKRRNTVRERYPVQAGARSKTVRASGGRGDGELEDLVMLDGIPVSWYIYTMVVRSDYD